MLKVLIFLNENSFFSERITLYYSLQQICLELCMSSCRIEADNNVFIVNCSFFLESARFGRKKYSKRDIAL